MKNPQINVVSVNIKELKPATYNPRKWSDDAIASLKASIEQFGLVDPILVNGAEGGVILLLAGIFVSR